MGYCKKQAKSFQISLKKILFRKLAPCKPVTLPKMKFFSGIFQEFLLDIKQFFVVISNLKNNFLQNNSQRKLLDRDTIQSPDFINQSPQLCFKSKALWWTLFLEKVVDCRLHKAKQTHMFSTANVFQTLFQNFKCSCSEQFLTADFLISF